MKIKWCLFGHNTTLFIYLFPSPYVWKRQNWFSLPLQIGYYAAQSTIMENPADHRASACIDFSKPGNNIRPAYNSEANRINSRDQFLAN